MPKEVDIQKVLHTWVVTASGLSTAKVLWQEQPKKGTSGATAPTGSFATLKIINGPKRFGEDERRMPDPNIQSEQMRIVKQSQIVVSVQTYGDGAFDNLEAVQDYFDDPDINGSLKGTQLDTVTIDQVIDDTDYTITLSGVAVTIDSGTGATTASIRDALIIAIDNESEVYAEATASGDDVEITAALGVPYSIVVGANLSHVQDRTAVDLGYLYDDGMIDVAELLDVSWEGRWACTFTFALSGERYADAGVIQAVTITEETLLGDDFTIDGR